MRGGNGMTFGLGLALWGLLLPHGLIELTSVVIAGAAGLRLGWTIIEVWWDEAIFRPADVAARIAAALL